MKKRKNMGELNKFLVLVLFLIIFIDFASTANDELIVISNPKPTCVEKNYTPLVLVKKIPLDFSEDHFLAIPSSIAVSDQKIFVFDSKVNAIFVFSKDFKFIKKYRKTGNGPGDIDKRTYFHKQLYFSDNGYLYLSDPGNKKILVFNKEVEHVKDIQIPVDFLSSVLPVVDTKGNFYLTSRDSVMEIFDKNMKKTHTLLNTKIYRRFLYIKSNSELRPSPSNTWYDVLSGNRLAIYILNSSTLYIFKNFKLETKFDVWPKTLIKNHKENIKEFERNLKGRDFFALIFNNFFTDKDNNEFIYFDAPIEREKNVKTLYKFNMGNKLVKVLYTKKKVDFKTKRNNLFYGLAIDGEILIFKEE